MKRPLVGIVCGDPNGIGAEVVVKAWGQSLKAHCRPVVIGSPDVIQHAIDLTGIPLEMRVVERANTVSDAGDVIDVIASAPFPAASIRFGHDTAEAGEATAAWLDHADHLARAGQLDATVMGPISSVSLKMVGKLDSIASHKAKDPAYLVLRSGRLVIAHLTDHIPLREVSAAITTPVVHTLVETFYLALLKWGVGTGHIAVAGFNPHASGTEEQEQIAPAIAQARAAGWPVDGPVSPDSVFRHCIEGRYDGVIAMYHDQGHIALKTWGFSGNSVVFLGPPYVHTTVAHGVAYDLAGRGKADSSMIQHAILDAASLAAGRGFFQE